VVGWFGWVGGAVCCVVSCCVAVRRVVEGYDAILVLGIVESDLSFVTLLL